MLNAPQRLVGQKPDPDAASKEPLVLTAVQRSWVEVSRRYSEK